MGFLYLIYTDTTNQFLLITIVYLLILMPDFPDQSLQSPGLSNSASRLAAMCLLLVMEDDLVANRIAGVVGATCSIVRFREVKGAKEWLTDNQKVNLIITDKPSGYLLANVLRSQEDYRLIPFLVTCRFGETHLVQTTFSTGVTDILVINEDNHRLLSKINYYLSLHTQIQRVDGPKSGPAVQPFQLPWWKRLFDISFSFTVLLLLSPVLLVVALLIVLDSKGPIIYKSKRAGANFHVFDMYKFRTMKAEADQLLGQLASQNIYAKTPAETDDTAPLDRRCIACREQGVACQQLLFDQDRPICEKLYLQETEGSAKFMKFRNDPRITRLGTFLRNSSIDELPQLFNILVGDMSLVGNRPLPLYEAEKLTSDEFARRFAGPAGLTGLWQVKKRAKGQGPMSDRERTLLDIEYSTTFSLKTDILIIWKTIFSLWQKENV